LIIKGAVLERGSVFKLKSSMPLTDLFNKIQKLQRFDIATETANIINQNGDFIASLLKSQLAEGKDGDGNDVKVFGREYYSDKTIFNKERFGSGLGKETGWITNYFSGAFYNSIYVFASGESFIFDSDIPYFNEIILQSGTKIMHLNKKNLEKFSKEILIPQLKVAFNAKVRQ